MTDKGPIQARLEYLRGQIEAECISYGEVAELQGLAEHIEPGDTQLLEWAGVPEFPEEDEERKMMYRTEVTFEVLSEEPIHPHMDVEAIVHECDEGSYVMADVRRAQTELSLKEMADALYAAGSQPDFFMLDDEGRKVQDSA